MKMNLIKALVLFVLALSGTAVAHDIKFDHKHHDGGYTVEKNNSFVSDSDTQSYLWNSRGKSNEQIQERIKYLASKYKIQRTPEEQKRADAARAKYSDAIAINSLTPTSVKLMGVKHEHYGSALKANYDAGMSLVSATVYGFEGANSEGLEVTLTESDKVGEEFGAIKTYSVDDVRKAKKQGKLAVVYNTQGSDYVAVDIAAKTAWSEKAGIKVMNFTYNNNNALAGGGSKQDMGLTEKGVEFVKAMNKEGITVDCSHSSNLACIEAAKVTTKPMIASHSNAKALFDHSRNVSDEAILAIGKTGGAVCPTGAGGFLSKDGKADPEIFAENVVYIAKLIGKDKVCYSTDWVHNVEDFYQLAVPNAEVYPPELGMAAPIENLHAENIWDVVAVLEDTYSWNEKEIRGFLGENLMRVYEASWKK